MARWNFIITDKNFVPLGELSGCHDRNVSLSLNKVSTFSFRLRLDSPASDYMLTNPCYIKGYRNKALKFYGPVVTIEENAGPDQQPSVAVNAAGIEWNLSHRMAGKSSTGRQFTAATDRSVIGKTLIDEANIESPLFLTTGTASSASSITYTAGPYKFIGDCISELSTAYDGFDWRVVPIDNFSGGAVTGSNIGTWEAYPVIGGSKPEAIFEWGFGRKNVSSYKRIWTRDQQANVAYHNTDAGPDAPGFPTVFSTDPSSIATWGRMDDLVTAQLLDNTLRQRLVDEHVVVRKYPRQTFELTPMVNPGGSLSVPEFGVDYGVGDLLPFRARYKDVLRFSGSVRVWGMTFAIDDNGMEKPGIIVSPDGVS